MISEIGIATARQLLDFAAGEQHNEAMWTHQLEGAVAMHNVLVRKRFGYLADEVGMGKTYVALGAVGLFRHFQPHWRVLYVAPNENIQGKWKKEILNFTARNWLVTDNRVRSLQGTPAWGAVESANLAAFAKDALVNADRDFILRMTSFSLGLSAENEGWKKRRDELLRIVPWLDRGLFDLRDKEEFKKRYACAINLVIPHFDLVIIDEAHNLKHGIHEKAAARNKLLGLVLGHPRGASGVNFPGYRKKFDRVLLLSATPLESDYVELWNQLQVFDLDKKAPILSDPEADESAKELSAKEFLIRRLTGLTINGALHTKNMYRREWRNGGVHRHDDPLALADERQRLIVALVQKKVAEVVGSERFNNSFQIGMLSSFESFMETTGAVDPGEDESDESMFSNASQTEDDDEKQGIDTASIRELARSYRRVFGEPLPHPKMDAIVADLQTSFVTGKKALIFVRRVKSVDELASKLNIAYDDWLEEYVASQLPHGCVEDFRDIVKSYKKIRSDAKRVDDIPLGETGGREAPVTTLESGSENPGDNDTLFSWFFRGEGPDRVFSGASFSQNRLASDSSTFFEDNTVAWLLRYPSSVVDGICDALGVAWEKIKPEIEGLAYGIFRSASTQRRFPRLRVFQAYQEAALRVLAKQALREDVCRQADLIIKERFGLKQERPLTRAKEFPDAESMLEGKTLFTEMRKRSGLYEELMPDLSTSDLKEQYRLREIRRELISASARLGHSLIDLWLLAVRRRGTLSMARRDRSEEGQEDLIRDFLDLLDQQRTAEGGRFGAYQELHDISHNIEIILSANFPYVRSAPLASLPKLFGRIMARQQPIGGMSGQVNKSLVRQFLMPGYPTILITTDVLREGADLHTFCSRVYHYGINWTPSSMEQRTGRIDRINSLTHRHLDRRTDAMPDEFLQVFYPHLGDTVERLQVERVYERMNRFIRMLHRSLAGKDHSDSCINTTFEFIENARDIAPILDPLETNFKVDPALLHAAASPRPIETAHETEALQAHFSKVIGRFMQKYRSVDEGGSNAWTRYMTVFIRGDGQLAAPKSGSGDVRQQPLVAFLKAGGGQGRTLLRCISPIGRVPIEDEERLLVIHELTRGISFGRVCMLLDAKLKTYNLTIEGDILFHPHTTQQEEVNALIDGVARSADHIESELLKRIDQTMDLFKKDIVLESSRG